MKNLLSLLILTIALASCGVPDTDVGKKDDVPAEDHRIFVTSDLLKGDFGAIEEEEGFVAVTENKAFTVADKKCNDLAKAAGLTRHYMAIISTEDVHASTRLTFTGAVYSVKSDGTSNLIAEAGSDLWLTEATKNLLGTIDLDEGGASRSGVNPWTGTGADGASTNSTCQSWTKTEGTGFIGSTDNFGNKWIENDILSCGMSAPIFCISQEK